MFSIQRLFSFSNRNVKYIHRLQKKHTLPALPYEYNALEPIICGEILQIHHMKHHAAYVNGLNDAEEKMKAAALKNDFCTMMELTSALNFNGGGHLNHSFYWESMSPCTSEPQNALAAAITSNFGSLDKMKDLMTQLAISVQGSGWAWLGYNPVSCKLQLAKTANQDLLKNTTGLIPLLTIDVWEHAYHIQYKNLRAEYVKNFWDIVNWQKVAERYAEATKN